MPIIKLFQIHVTRYIASFLHWCHTFDGNCEVILYNIVKYWVIVRGKVISSYFSFEDVDQQQQQHRDTAGLTWTLAADVFLEGITERRIFHRCWQLPSENIDKNGGCGQVMLIPRAIKFLNKTLRWLSSGTLCFWSRGREVVVASSPSCDGSCRWQHAARRPDRWRLPPYVTGTLLSLPGLSLTWRDHIVWAPVFKSWRRFFPQTRRSIFNLISRQRDIAFQPQL